MRDLKQMCLDQHARVMPVVGSVLDCLDGLDNDTRGQLEDLAPNLFEELAKLRTEADA